MTGHKTPSCGCYAGLVVSGAVPRATLPGAPVETPTLAELVLDAAAAGLRAHPPPGVDAAYLDWFLARSRPALVRIVPGA